MAEAPTSFGLGEVGKDFIAGTFAGCAGILTGHPFDTIKVRLQTQTHTPGTQLRYSGTIHCFVKIVREEKIRGLYKGMASPMAGVALINAMLFGVYGNSVRLLEGSGSAEPARRPSIQTVFIAGAASGLPLQRTTFICTCFLQGGHVESRALWHNLLDIGAAAATAAATAEPLYKGPWDCFVRTVRQDGIRGIYRGLVPTMLRETPSYGVYFAAYEMLCLRLAGPGRSPDDLSAPALMLAGGASGMAGWLSTYPTDVVKSRMQADSMTNPQYRGFVDCVVKSYRAEGLGVFFRGFNATMVRAFPTNASTFVVYTMCMRLLGGVDTSQDHSHTRHME
ncbi:carnitine/acylcarnitine carrier protein [Capsaspora owczarzaki ATCC 30864]|uniref:carnitine/acylcarnitine carrier protein n=1 Tax=Capsaspora owczarzaki (strain ATCC 30864) TaxID=595528 RepID=UPI0001FE3076|nr:carnitine/acylcarnitine carrier protein [Capsaspora owczarzaki ATCC 30864]|eukprot:XP_004342638.1 carnitine/acylcarnitine carrier protein [Capsaspora owczarzaki ATCC 30864]